MLQRIVNRLNCKLGISGTVTGAVTPVFCCEGGKRRSLVYVLIAEGGLV